MSDTPATQTDDAIKQTASERAMFANMGASGGGGGGGGKPSGGTGGLWAANPETGKREESQGLAKGAKPSAGKPEDRASLEQQLRQDVRSKKITAAEYEKRMRDHDKQAFERARAASLRGPAKPDGRDWTPAEREQITTLAQSRTREQITTEMARDHQSLTSGALKPGWREQVDLTNRGRRAALSEMDTAQSTKAAGDSPAAAAAQAGAPGNTGTPGKRTPSERARLAALARWGKYKGGAKKPAPKGRKPAQTPEEKEAARRQAAQANRAAVATEMGISTDDQASLDALAMGKPPGDTAALVKAGIVELGKDGTPRFTAAGKQFYNAAGRGDAGAAGDALSRGKDKAPQPKEDKPAAEAEKPKAGGGGGGGGGKEKPDKAEERAKMAADTAGKVGLKDVDALRAARDEGGAESTELRELGLIDDNGDATDQGRRALTALELGNVGTYRAALQDAKSRLGREAAAQAREQKQRAKPNKQNGVEIKQTAQQRAMFANMGSSGGGGGKGGGGKPTGGTGGLWKPGPDGKRTPDAGYQTPVKPGTPRAEGLDRGDIQKLSRARQAKQRIANIDRQLAGDISPRQRASLHAERARLRDTSQRDLATVSNAAAPRSNAIHNSAPAPTVRGRGGVFNESRESVTYLRNESHRARERRDEAQRKVDDAERRLTEVQRMGVRPGQQAHEKRDLADAKRELTRTKRDVAEIDKAHAQAERTFQSEMRRPANLNRAADHAGNQAWSAAWREPGATRERADAAREGARQRVLTEEAPRRARAAAAPTRDRAAARSAYDRYAANERRSDALTKQVDTANARAQERGITPAERRTRQATATRLREERNALRQSQHEDNLAAIREIEAAGYTFGRQGQLAPNRRAATTTPQPGFNSAGYGKAYDMDTELKYSRRHSAIDEDAMARGMQYLKAARLAFVEAGAPDEDGDGLPDIKSIPEIADDAHPGAMVCLVVPDEIQELLDGDTPDHVTICYLGGDANTLEEHKTDIIAALARVALHGSPIEGFLGGVARFNASDSTDGRDVLVALVDSPDLPLLHAAVSEALDDCDIDLPADHGFIPHITLEYLDPDERMPRLTIPREPITFDALTIVWAGERIDLPFGDEDEEADDAPKMPMYIGAVKSDEEIDLAPVGAIKALGDYALAVRGIVYGGEDLVGDAFIKATDLGFGRDPTGMPVYYDHARSGLKSQIGHVTAWKADDEGILFDVELDKRHQYAAMVMGLARKGALGGSTGALSHLVIRRDGELKRWIVGELSLTPTPAEPRSIAATKATDPEALPPAAIDETPEADTEAAKAADVSGALLAHTLTTIAARQIARRYQ